MHIYIYTHSHTHTHTHTYIHTILPTVYYSCHLVVSSYHKSYLQYFDILLNYIKLQTFCYKKKKQINKWK